MVVGNQSSQSLLANGDDQVESLERMVHELQCKCEKLGEALTKAESEREAYRQLFLQEARERREFGDHDIPTLERMSSGPVEKLSCCEDGNMAALKMDWATPPSARRNGFIVDC